MNFRLNLLKSSVLLFFFTTIFFFQTVVFAKNSYRHEVAVCAIFQNEAPYLKEWIEFHQKAGVDYFYLFNNLSTDHYKSVLEPYIKSGLVKLIDWPYRSEEIHSWNTIQCEAYNKALKLASRHVKWLAILDTDEFLFPVKNHSLSQFLKSYEDFGGIAVNWQMYGTSHVKEISPGQSLIESLILKAPTNYSENIHVKSIVRPNRVKKFENPHFCYYKSGYFAVNSNREIVEGAFSPYILIDKIRINHYWTRDENYFIKHKVPRRQHWSDVQFFERAERLNHEVDTAILDYLSKLKKSG